MNRKTSGSLISAVQYSATQYMKHHMMIPVGIAKVADMMANLKNGLRILFHNGLTTSSQTFPSSPNNLRIAAVNAVTAIIAAVIPATIRPTSFRASIIDFKLVISSWSLPGDHNVMVYCPCLNNTYSRRIGCSWLSALIQGRAFFFNSRWITHRASRCVA